MEINNFHSVILNSKTAARLHLEIVSFIAIATNECAFFTFLTSESSLVLLLHPVACLPTCLPVVYVQVFVIVLVFVRNYAKIL